MQAIKSKVCKVCLRERLLCDFTPLKGGYGGVRPECKPCRALAQKGKIQPPVPPAQRRLHVRTARLRKYGLTAESFNDLCKLQNNACAICQTPKRECRDEMLQVDHSHKTGAVRGLLCEHCNTLLARARDDENILHRAIAYLRSRDV